MQPRDGGLHCRVIGNVLPRGVCGSGLVAAAAAALDLGLIRPDGRLADGGVDLPLAPPVKLTQKDIRELQLAKGAIAAGLTLLLRQWGAEPSDLEALHLAGAFGNYINLPSAHRIGLFDCPPDKVRAGGNTALLGTKMALFGDDEETDYRALRQRVTHVPLAADPQFQAVFVKAVGFPEPDAGAD